MARWTASFCSGDGRQAGLLYLAAGSRDTTGNRRYRKMQKSIDSVRTQEQIKARIALDMWREAQGEGRDQTLHALHKARAG